jgi:hypothetical protein
MRGFGQAHRRFREPLYRSFDEIGVGAEHGFVRLAGSIFVKAGTGSLFLRALREIATTRRLLPRRLQALHPTTAALLHRDEALRREPCWLKRPRGLAALKVAARLPPRDISGTEVSGLALEARSAALS